MESYNVYEIVSRDYSLQWFSVKAEPSMERPTSLILNRMRHSRPIMRDVSFVVATDIVQDKYRSISGKTEEEIKSLGMIIAEFDGEILSSEE